MGNNANIANIGEEGVNVSRSAHNRGGTGKSYSFQIRRDEYRSGRW